MRTRLLLCVAVAAMMLTAVSGFGQVSPPDVCVTLSSPDVVTPPGTNTATIGVASNFYYPAQTFVGNYLSAQTNTSITICHNSTANLEAQLAAAPPAAKPYDMLFAADTSATGYNYPGNPAYPVFNYARGIPVIFAEYNPSQISTASQLIDGTSTTNPFDTINTSVLIPTYKVASGLTGTFADVAVADPAKAPYGAAARTILTALGYPTPMPPFPDWVYTPLFGNIAQTFTAVVDNTNYPKVVAGWVGESQICSGIDTTPPTYVYVEFTNNAFTLVQNATITTTNSVGMALYDYIKTQRNSGGWATFLANNCYAQP